MIQLQDKHLSGQKAQLGSLVFGPTEDIPHVIYHQINGEIIKEAALKTKGSGGPWGSMQMVLEECSLASPIKSLVQVFVTP